MCPTRRPTDSSTGPVRIDLDVASVAVDQARTGDPGDDLTLLMAHDQALVVARVEARSAAAIGDPIVSPAIRRQSSFFSPATGENLRGDTLTAAAPSYQG